MNRVEKWMRIVEKERPDELVLTAQHSPNLKLHLAIKENGKLSIWVGDHLPFDVYNKRMVKEIVDYLTHWYLTDIEETP